MFAEERYKKIIEVIERAGKATVSELSEAMGVSPVTVRRDLEKLEENNLLIRTHGGAISTNANVVGTSVEKSFSEKEEALVAEKDRIAAEAASWVKEEEAVLLTPGTTNMLLAKHLAAKKHLTVVTNAVNIATYLSLNTSHDVILIGGRMRSKSLASVGGMAENSLRQIRVDKLFLGVDGIDLDNGLTTPNLEEASVNRCMMEIAAQIIVVADHSKFGKVTFSQIASMNQIDALITDHYLESAFIEKLEQSGVTVKLV